MIVRYVCLMENILLVKVVLIVARVTEGARVYKEVLRGLKRLSARDGMSSRRKFPVLPE